MASYTSGSPGAGQLEIGIALVLQDRFSNQAREASGVIKKLHNDAKMAVNANAIALQVIANGVSSFAIGMAGTLSDVVIEGAEFVDTMTTVSAITEATDAQLNGLSETAQTLGLRTMFMSREIASGMKFLAMAGNDANQIQDMITGAAMMANATGMALGDVYQALQTKTIDGAENPIATLYGRKLHEVAPYLILDGHVKNFTTWVVSADWFNSLTEEQQNWLVETAQEAGEYNNQVLQEAEQEYLQLMVDEGVTVVDPSEEVLEGFREKAASFYEMGDRFGWSDGLYDTVRKAMGAEE